MHIVTTSCQATLPKLKENLGSQYPGKTTSIKLPTIGIKVRQQ